MKPIRALLTLVLPISLFAIGCTEDVGSCDDPLKGRDTVVVAGSIQYAGQAIMNVSCAALCHNSSFKGEARQGAPAGLNFDLTPIDESGATGMLLKSADGSTVLKLADDDVHGLRNRQRDIFEKRNLIWAQVKEGLMPPDGKFKSLRVLAGIKDSPETSPCTASKNGYLDITEKPSQDVLRSWLACSTPIVEATGTSVVVMSGDNGAEGTAGYQYASCDGTEQPGDGGVGDGGGVAPAVVTLEQLEDTIFKGLLCNSCHPALNPTGVKLDLTSVDKAYSTLVMDTAIKCNGKPYVTPGNPAMSWLYDVVSLDDPGCDTQRMPQNLKDLTPAQLKLVSDWITGGAKRAADVKSAASPLVGGLDAGLP